MRVLEMWKSYSMRVETDKVGWCHLSIGLLK